MTATAVRAEPAWLSVPDYAETDGDLAAGIAEQVGYTADGRGQLGWHQRQLLDAIFAVDNRGRPVCSQTAIIGPRQTVGKTAALEVAALTDLLVLGVEVHVWTAHLFPTARKSFERMVQLIDYSDDLRRLCRKPRTANGDEKIQRLTGESIEFHARSKGGGRGFAGVERVTLDEGLFLSSAEMGALGPMKVTMPNAQTRVASSAGLVTSAVLRQIRERGRSGRDDRLGYIEFAAPRRECESPDCSHLFGRVDGCALDDDALLLAANPLGEVGASMDTLTDQRRELPPEEFAREFLGWWDEPADLVELFGEGAWEALAVRSVLDGGPGSAIAGVPTFGLAATPDLAWGCVGAAGPSTDPAERTHVEPLRHARRTGWLVDEAARLTRTHGGRVVVDGRGPAANLVPELEAAGVSVDIASTSDVLDACAQFDRAVVDGQIIHMSLPELDAAVAGAQRRTVGDRFAWGRKTGIDITPLEAVTLATWGCRQHVGNFNIW